MKGLLYLILFSALSIPANAAFQLIPVAGVNQTTAKSNDSGVGFSPKTSMMAGALLELPTPGSLGLEFGFFMVNRKYTKSTRAGSVTNTSDVSVNYYQVPIVLRWHFIRFLSLGGGGFYSRGYGSIDENFNNKPATKTFSQLGLRDHDYGALASFRIDIPMSLITGLMFEARYLKGLSNANAEINGSIFKFSDTQFMAGFRIGFAN